MHTKKIPMRMCLGCGKSKVKMELVRVVKNNENEIFIDLTGKKAGRGAYLCKSEDCLNKAMKTRKLNRAFSCEIDDELYNKLRREILEQAAQQTAEKEQKSTNEQ